MKRLLEITLFLGFSAGLHAAILVPISGGTTPGSGQMGADRTTVQAASGDIAAMVARWTAPPDVAVGVSLSAPEVTAVPELAVKQVEHPVLRPSPNPIIAQSTPETLPQIPTAVDRPAPPSTDMAGLSRPIVPDISFPNAPSPDAPIASRTPEVAPPPRPDSVPDHTSALAVTQSARPGTRPDGLAPSTPAPALQTERSAAGTGGGAAQGTAGTAPSATQSVAERRSLMAGWGAQITASIERRKPRVSGAGVMTVQLVVARSGQVQSIGIAQSSGNAAIDEAGIMAVRNAGQLPSAPDGLDEPAYRFNLPIRFL